MYNCIYVLLYIFIQYLYCYYIYFYIYNVYIIYIIYIMHILYVYISNTGQIAWVGKSSLDVLVEIHKCDTIDYLPNIG